MKRQDDIRRLYELLSNVTLALHPRAEIRLYEADLESFTSRFEPSGQGDSGTRVSSAPVSPLPRSTAVQEEPGEGAETLSAEDRKRRLSELAEEIRMCEKCPLSLGRINAVPGEGVIDPMVMIIGEGPGAQEDEEGSPFVGRAGQYLDKWLSAIGLSRDTDVYIANIVKCRPPSNRDPKPEECDLCLPYLQEQISLIQPKLILTVGRISTRILTGTSNGITRIHGTFYHYRGIPLVPTFHPSGVLRNPAWRRPVWEDLKSVRNWLIDNVGHTPS